MKPGTRCAAALLIALAAAGHAAADETYVGTVTVPQAAAPVAVTVTVRQYTADERANELAQMLHNRGHADVAAALAKERLGEVRLGDARFHLTLARQEPTGTGRILRLVTDRPLHAGAKPAGTAPPADAVGYLELTLDAKDAGEGKLHPAVRARFDADGFVAPETVGGAAPWPVTGVKRQP